MRCLECKTKLQRLDNDHLLSCSGLTVQEYAIRHHVPLDLILQPDQVNLQDSLEEYASVTHPPRAEAQSVLAGLRLVGLVHEEQALSVISAPIKCLEQLLWDLQWVKDFGFQFRQEYHYTERSHRVFARNRLKTLTSNVTKHALISPLDAPDFRTTIAVSLAHGGEYHAGYLFWRFGEHKVSEVVAQRLRCDHQIVLIHLDDYRRQPGALLRTETIDDAQRLLDLLSDRLLEIPTVEQRFFTPGTEATVVKELEFDSAHFITDHPGKCSNLHGGRYGLHVKIKDRIDANTGFVVDYGDLKRIVRQQIIEKLDHQNLNYVTAELAWRSSTELLCVFIWEQLIGYLPGLVEIEIHETAQSYCCYSGPSLAEFQRRGSNRLLTHFKDAALGRSSLRQLIDKDRESGLRVVGSD